MSSFNPIKNYYFYPFKIISYTKGKLYYTNISIHPIMVPSMIPSIVQSDTPIHTLSLQRISVPNLEYSVRPNIVISIEPNITP